MRNTRMVKLQAAFAAGFLGTNLLEAYFPFLANIICSEKMTLIVPVKISESFKRRYGFEIPLTFIRSILSIGVQRGLFQYDKQYGRYYVVRNDIDGYGFDAHEFDSLWERLKLEFCRFACKANLAIPENELDENLLKCIECHNDRVLSSADDEIIKPNDPLEFVWDSFVVEINRKDERLYEFIASVSLCNVIRDAKFFDGDARSKFSGMRIYLDTSIAFSVIGFDEEPRIALARYFVKQLRESGCQVLVFDHCKKEMERIIESANYWIHRSDYSIDKASPIARNFFERKLTEEDVIQILENLEDELGRFGIKVEETAYRTDDDRFQQDEIKLQKILECKYEESGRLLDDIRRESILVDIRSLIFVYRNRRGYSPAHLYDARCLMVTFNMALNKTANEYARNVCRESIPACMSVDIFSTALWFFSPVQMREYKKLQLLSDCYSATNPSKELLAKYVEALEIARQNGEIDDQKFILYKTSTLVRRPLAIVTRGCDFTDETVMEVVKRVEEEARFKHEEEIKMVKEAAQEEVDKQRVSAENELRRTRDEMLRVAKEKDAKIHEEKSRANEYELRALEMERLVSTTARANEKILDVFASILTFIVLFPALSLLLGYLLNLLEVLGIDNSDMSVVRHWMICGTIAFATDILMFMCKKVRDVIKMPIKALIRKWVS